MNFNLKFRIILGIINFGCHISNNVIFKLSKWILEMYTVKLDGSKLYGLELLSGLGYRARVELT